MRYAGSLFPLVLVGVLAALTFWLQSVAEPPAVDRSGRSRHDPDFIVENFTVRRFDPTGLLQHTVAATRMMHYPDDDTTTVIAPHVTFHGQPPSLLQAEEAQISRDAKEVRLQRNVVFTRTNESGGLPTVVQTATLDVQPDAETASTDAPVTITQGRSIVTGSGLRMDNKIQQTALLGPVRGTVYRDTGKSP